MKEHFTDEQLVEITALLTLVNLDRFNAARAGESALAVHPRSRPRVGTGIGGIIGPQLFAPLIATGKASEVFKALAIGAGLMIIGGVAEIVFGVKAERRGLEGIAKPLTAVENAPHRSTTPGPVSPSSRPATG